MSQPMISVAGIRGIVGDSLVPEEFLRYALAFAKTRRAGGIVVGGDTRLSRIPLRRLVFAALEFSGLEAMDLGVTMARHWWRRLLASWLVTILPWFIVVWAIFWPHPIWAALVLWWLKPLWDRVPLFVLSRALFGAEPTVGETIRAAPRLWKEHLGLSLFLYRLDPVRTFFLPVLQLEKSAGQTMYRRRGVLLRNSLGSASWLTLTCICLELVVMVGLLGLALIMLPDRPEWSGAFLWEQFEEDQLPVPLRLWYAVSAFVALTVVEPLYVACGFALYVNRRTELEGWDIELIFRQLAQRLQTTSAPAGQRLGEEAEADPVVDVDVVGEVVAALDEALLGDDPAQAGLHVLVVKARLEHIGGQHGAVHGHPRAKLGLALGHVDPALL